MSRRRNLSEIQNHTRRNLSEIQNHASINGYTIMDDDPSDCCGGPCPEWHYCGTTGYGRPC